jgi:hypothetical protein
LEPIHKSLDLMPPRPDHLEHGPSLRQHLHLLIYDPLHLHILTLIVIDLHLTLLHLHWLPSLHHSWLHLNLLVTH